LQSAWLEWNSATFRRPAHARTVEATAATSQNRIRPTPCTVPPYSGRASTGKRSARGKPRRLSGFPLAGGAGGATPASNRCDSHTMRWGGGCAAIAHTLIPRRPMVHESKHSRSMRWPQFGNSMKPLTRVGLAHLVADGKKKVAAQRLEAGFHPCTPRGRKPLRRRGFLPRAPSFGAALRGECRRAVLHRRFETAVGHEPVVAL